MNPLGPVIFGFALIGGVLFPFLFGGSGGSFTFPGGTISFNPTGGGVPGPLAGVGLLPLAVVGAAVAFRRFRGRRSSSVAQA